MIQARTQRTTHLGEVVLRDAAWVKMHDLIPYPYECPRHSQTFSDQFAARAFANYWAHAAVEGVPRESDSEGSQISRSQSVGFRASQTSATTSPPRNT
jgi:hypothetical protein